VLAQADEVAHVEVEEHALGAGIDRRLYPGEHHRHTIAAHQGPDEPAVVFVGFAKHQAEQPVEGHRAPDIAHLDEGHQAADRWTRGARYRTPRPNGDVALCQRPARVVLQLDDAARLVDGEREPNRRVRVGRLLPPGQPDSEEQAIALGSRLLQQRTDSMLELRPQRREHLLAVMAAARPVAVPADIVGQQPLDHAQVVAAHRVLQRLECLMPSGAHRVRDSLWAPPGAPSDNPAVAPLAARPSIASPRSRIRPAVASPPQ
jgi:hypothetical protein